MKYFNKKNTQNKENTKLPMGKKSKKALAAYAAVVPVSYTHLSCPQGKCRPPRLS